MELRVLVAVFVTLFGIAVGMAGGDINAQQLTTALMEFQGAGDLSSLIQYSTDKTANTSLTAEMVAEDENTINIRNAVDVELVLESRTALRVADARITPSEDTTITFNGFTGSIAAGETVSIDGSVVSLNTDQLSFNYSTPRTVIIEDGMIARVTMRDVNSETLQFDAVSGSVTAGNNTITFADKAVFEFFHGEVVMDIEDGSYELDGRVHRALVGAGTPPIIIGGQ